MLACFTFVCNNWGCPQYYLGASWKPSKKNLTGNLTPSCYGQWKCLPLWQTTISWCLEHQKGISILYTQIKSMPWGKKSRVNYIDIFKRLWGDTTPMYLLSLLWADGCCVVVEGDLTPYLIPDVYGIPVSCSASWRRGSVSSGIVMAKVTILSCSRWAAALNIALIWPFVSSWGNSEG